MRGNKTGLADLKRLHEQVRETRARAEAAEREAAARASAAAPPWPSARRPSAAWVSCSSGVKLRK